MILPRKAVQTLSAYHAPEEERWGKVRLDFNENTTSWWEASNETALAQASMYPEYNQFIAQLAQFLEISPDWLMLTNGSDEALFLIASTFIEPNQGRALLSSPTFQMIPHYLHLAQAQIIDVPALPNLSYDLAQLETRLKEGVTLAMFASPNNPTGAIIPLGVLESWCRQYPHTLFVLDEAYVEYTQESGLDLVRAVPNLVLTRTFSKAWGLAGLRLGYVIAPPHLIDSLMRVRSPYSVNAVAVEKATTLLHCSQQVMQAAKDAMKRKAEMVQHLSQRGFGVVAGHANFFLLALGMEASALTQYCKQHNVLIRDRSRLPQMEGMVRVSMGSQEEMASFLDCLERFYREHVLIFDLDDTLVDTSQSYTQIVQELVATYTGFSLPVEEIYALKAEGGYNDDWVATVELLRRRDCQVTPHEIVQKAQAMYFDRAAAVETLMISESLLEKLNRRYRMMIVTGRTRAEYDRIWGERLNPYFEHVVCVDDVPALLPKPAPDMLTHAMTLAQAKTGVYIGNAVDDMQAARAAGLLPIGIPSTLPESTLRQAGANMVLNSIQQLEEELAL